MSSMIASKTTIRRAALAFAYGQMGDNVEAFISAGLSLSNEELDTIARRLYALNVKAYNGRYKENVSSELDEPIFESHSTYKLKDIYSEHTLNWAKSLEFVLYQCCEESTTNDPFLADIMNASQVFQILLLQHSPAYVALPWGE